MGIIIHSAKSKKNQTIEITYREGESVENVSEVTRVFKNAKPHPDLVNAMKALKPHAAYLSDYRTLEQMTAKKDKAKIARLGFADADDEGQFVVSGFHVSDKGIILTAQKETKSGKMMNFNTPLVNPDAEGEQGYEFIDDLAELIDNASKEFSEFLNGKVAADPQGGLNFDEGAE